MAFTNLLFKKPVYSQILFFTGSQISLAAFFERTDTLKKLKSYTSIWNVEKVLYSISDFQLPFPITFSQMAWFVLSLFLIMLLGSLPPFSLIDNVLIKYLLIPCGITWFMSQKSFDGKRPFSFVRSVIAFLIRPKITYAGKAVRLHKKHMQNDSITAVRSVLYVPDKIY